MTQAVGDASGAPAGGAPAGGAPAGGAPAGGAPAATWTDGIADVGVRDFAINKGYNKMDAAAAAPIIAQQYQNLEKLIGAEKAGRTVEIPNWEADDDSAKASRQVFNEKMGVPKAPGDYKLQLLGKDGKVNEATSNAFAGMLHKAGVPARSVAGLAKDFTDFRTAEIAAEKIADQTKYAEQDKALKTEWGSKYDDNMALAKSAAKAFGVTAEQLDAAQNTTDYLTTMKLFTQLASKIGEAQFLDGGKGSNDGKMTPAEAKVEMKKFLGDAENRKGLMDKHHPKHAELMARKAQLSAWEVGQ